MYLYILFGQRKESYAGEHAPEPLLCWSEYEVDENPEGFDQDVVDKSSQAAKAGFVATRVIKVSVNQSKIENLLVGQPTIQGDVEND